MGSNATARTVGRFDPRGAEPGTAPGDFLFNGDNLTAYGSALHKGVDLIQRNLAGVEQPFSGVLPGELRQQFEGIDLDRPAPDLDSALGELEDVYLRDAVYFHHPRYVAHLNCPIAMPAILAELILSSVNSSLDTWDQSAGATYIEQKLIDWTADRLGLGRFADGVFTSGGSQSNLMALLVAREVCCRWHRGSNGAVPDASKLRIFASEVGHFSVDKAATILGLSDNAVVPVPCDEHLRMDPQALADAIADCQADGLIPMAVVGTAGTTDFGSIDPLAALGSICRNQGIWFHVDAAYGCGLFASTRRRHWLRGIEYADSVTADYHKSFFQPVSCGAFLVRDGGHLGHLTYHADYLNPASQRREGTPNQVDKTIQTTRRFDALKLWLTLRTIGAEAVGDAFDQTIDLAADAYALMAGRKDIECCHTPELGCVVFRYRPTAVGSEDELDRVNARIRKDLMRSGEALVAGTKVAGRQYLKFTLLDPTTTLADVEQILSLIEQHGEAATAR
jgi:L-2,4-diaminobutyrate decarboxylase